jgi:hypothetical protein
MVWFISSHTRISAGTHLVLAARTLANLRQETSNVLVLLAQLANHNNMATSLVPKFLSPLHNR